MAAFSKEEYLKRYLSNSDSGAKKKRRKKMKVGAKAGRSLIIDDDVNLSDIKVKQDAESHGNLLEVAEDKPLIFDEAGTTVLSRDLEAIKRNEEARKAMWAPLRDISTEEEHLPRLPDHLPERHGNDGRRNSPDVLQEKSDSPPVNQSPPRRRTRHDSEDISPPRRQTPHGSKDMSPPRRRTRRDFEDMSPPRRQARHDSEDKSPPRRQTPHGSKDMSPPRRQTRHDSEDISPPRGQTTHGSKDMSPPRRQTTEDMSPPRRQTKHDSEDKSPPRGQTPHGSKDMSPPRRRQTRHDSEDKSPPRAQTPHGAKDMSPPRRRTRRDSEDISPPRRQTPHGSKDMSPPRRQTRHDSEDISPPRGQTTHGSKDMSPPRRQTTEDMSPPRRQTKHNSEDKLPPRRQTPHGSKDTSPPRRRTRHNSEDISPPRKSRPDSSPDQSPPRRNKSEARHALSNVSSVQKSSHFRGNSDQSPPRKQDAPKMLDNREGIRSRKRSRYDSPEHSLPQQKRSKHHRSDVSSKKEADLSLKQDEPIKNERKVGLHSGAELRRENQLTKRREDETFSRMSSSATGKGAETVHRDKKGRKRDLIEEKAKKKEEERKKMEEDEKFMEWGKGLQQTKEAKEKAHDDDYEMSKPLARYKDDEDLDAMMRDRDRAGDPMLAFLQKKKVQQDAVSGKKEKPKYKGRAPPPTRFNIPPGYRWDGVDRSNGFEKKRFAMLANKGASREEAYKWSTEDM